MAYPVSTFPRRRKATLVPIFLVINVAVFFWWQSSPEIAYGVEGFMSRNFLVSWESLKEGRYWVLLTSVFSHHLFLHLLFNMIVLASFGPPLERVLGSARFFIFYLAAGIFSSISHASLSKFLLGLPEQQALGASGALAGVLLVFSLLFPREKILLFAIIPVPAIVGALAFIGLDLWGLFAQAQGGGLPIGHGAHLGGAFAGIIYYIFVARKYRH